MNPPKESYPLVVEFDNPEARYQFAAWLCGSGEQHYWDWMEYREMDHDGPITVLNFDYDFKNGIIKTKTGRNSK